MELNSPWFWILFVLACLFMISRARQKSPAQVSPRKQLIIRGKKIKTPIHPKTPLECLLAEGHRFGQDYAEKEAPPLPHGPGCQCEVVDSMIGSHDYFTDQIHDPYPSPTDLGKLDAEHLRYYKMALIAAHPEADSELRQIHQKAIAQSSMDEVFKNRVESHIQISKGEA